MNPASPVLAGVAVVLAFVVPRLLDGSAWAERAPRAAIAVWQAVGLSAALAAVGAGLSLATSSQHKSIPAGLADLFSRAALKGERHINGLSEAVGLTLAAIVVAVLISGLAVTAARTAAARRRHRILLDLVSEPSEVAPGTVLLHDARATAYCLPGRHHRIVLSDGAVGMLTRHQLSAVVDHERGHVHERHHLVMLPFASITEMLSWLPYAARGPAAVAGLLEMAADDFASRGNDRRELARALVTLAGSNAVPSCAFAATGTLMTARVRRLVGPEAHSRLIAGLAGVAAVTLVGLPITIMAALG
jgi:Zn-dependent protease with chaperone function